MEPAGNCCSPSPCGASLPPGPESVAAALAQLAVGTVQGGIGIVRGVVHGLMWNQSRQCSAHTGCLACAGVHHCCVVACFPRLPCAAPCMRYCCCCW